MNRLTIRKAALLLVAIAAFQTAGAQKIAHLSLDSLVSLMPETKTATEAAQEYLKGLNEESVAMQTEFESKYKDYLEKEAGMSDLLKKNKQEDLQQLQNRIQEFQRQAEQDYRRKQAELTAPILEKAKKGIEAVAKENGYKYVLDTSTQNTTVLYCEPGDDILNAVKKKLDGMPLATIPGLAPPGTGGIKTPPAPNKGNPPKGK
ncbi:MAG TPA: OmpH family outer membrane protein [Bacteroidia bacterium]|nr:OmpH family outer membrane protein [Bacteroidia bacterium]